MAHYWSIENTREQTAKSLLKSKGFGSRALRQMQKEKLLSTPERPIKPTETLQAHEVLRIRIEDEDLDYEPMSGELDVVYEDDYLLVVDKPAGLTMYSEGDNLCRRIAAHFQERGIHAKIRLVNRLDMNTQGFLLVAKNGFMHGLLQKQLHSQDFERSYLALVEGILEGEGTLRSKLKKEEETKRMVSHPQGKEAITHYEALCHSEDQTVVKCTLSTGRNHQIRAQLAEAGFPLVNDRLYSGRGNGEFILVSYRISFLHPADGKRREIEKKIDKSIFPCCLK